MSHRNGDIIAAVYHTLIVEKETSGENQQRKYGGGGALEDR